VRPQRHAVSGRRPICSLDDGLAEVLDEVLSSGPGLTHDFHAADLEGDVMDLLVDAHLDVSSRPLKPVIGRDAVAPAGTEGAEYSPQTTTVREKPAGGEAPLRCTGHTAL
jgi:hypothetical protein